MNMEEPRRHEHAFHKFTQVLIRSELLSVDRCYSNEEEDSSDLTGVFILCFRKLYLESAVNPAPIGHPRQISQTDQPRTQALLFAQQENRPSATETVGTRGNPPSPVTSPTLILTLIHPRYFASSIPLLKPN